MNNELCHCGKPLHYSSKAVQDVIEKIIEFKGSRYTLIKVIESGKTYKVDVHYVALHGVEAKDLPTLGFEEVLD